MSLSHARPYGFERVFAANDPIRGGSPQDLGMQARSARAELAKLEASHARGVSDARADGFATGLAQARSETAQALLSASTRVADTVEALSIQFSETEARISRAAGELALAAAEVLAARAIVGQPLASIDEAIGRVLSQIGTREELRVRIHPTLSAELRTMIAARDSAGQRPLAIIVADDETVTPGDARILWERGGLSLDAAARALAVREELAALLPAPPA